MTTLGAFRDVLPTLQMALDRRQYGIEFVVEGVDGSGKTTLTHDLVRILAESGVPAILVNKQFGTDGNPAPPLIPQCVVDRLLALYPVVWGPFPANRSSWSEKHWLFIIGSWFSLLSENVIAPLVSAGYVVVVDNAHYKTMARYYLKPQVSESLIASVFSGLRRPEGICLLEVDPAVALNRKGEFSLVEAGFQSTDNLSFIHHQAELAVALRSIFSHNHPEIINTTTLSSDTVLKLAFHYLAHTLTYTGADESTMTQGQGLPSEPNPLGESPFAHSMDEGELAP